MDYFVQLYDDPCQWESVPERVFVDRKFALDTDGNPRYTENWFITVKEEGEPMKLSIHCDEVPVELLGMLARLYQIHTSPSSPAVGKILQPEVVLFQKGRSRFLFHCETGKRYKAA